MYPRGRQFATDFPGLRATIRKRFEEGAAPASAASQIAAEILGDVLRQLATTERSAVLDGILAADPETVKGLAAQRLAGGGTTTHDAVAFATSLAATAIYMARRMVEAGTLGRDELRHLLAAIEAALGAEGRPLAENLESGGSGVSE